MIETLLLLSGNDIPFREARINIYQPKIKEIAYIGEESFFIGCELLNFSKDILTTQDKSNLENKSNFEVFMSIMGDKKTKTIQGNRISAFLVLSLIFPNYEIEILKDKIVLINDSQEEFFINENNFEKFKEILSLMFCLKKQKDEKQNYNPAGGRAKAIADKIKVGREKAAAAKNEKQKISVLNRYVSILTVGENKNMNDLLNLTVFQLFDEFERFELKQSFDAYVQQRLAGAKDIEEVDNWMKEIHS